MKNFIKFFSLIFILLALSNCVTEDSITKDTDTGVMSKLDIPLDFNFETAKDVTVSFSGVKVKSTNKIKYSVYLYDEEFTNTEVTYEDESGETVNATLQISDALNNKIASFVTSEEIFEMEFTIPSSYNSLYVVKNEMGIFSSSIIEINNQKSIFKKGVSTKATKAAVDIFYGTNGGGDLFTINEVSNELTVISSLPDNTGSYTCAIDPISRKLYTIGNKSPNNLYCFNIDEETWETIGSVNTGGPRLGYNITDGMLYFSTSNYVYVLDPSNAKRIATYKINGLETTSGGDLAFDKDGTMYLSSTTGLYKCEFADGNAIDATWISSETLPNYPNSLTFDSNGELWWATAIGSEGLTFIMDKVTGGFESRSTYPTLIHDLATLPYDESSISDVDTDGDGVIDFYDEFPEDAEKASVTYTPSIYGWGTYGFEDLWPSKGDYDFNDLVVNYRYINIENADGLMVETRLNYVVKNIGGSLKNGFGIQFEMDESLIKEVSGYHLTENIVSLNGKGLESDQTLPVVIVFDNAWANSNDSEIEIVIAYTEPIESSMMGELNPFIFTGGNRGKEIHCANQQPTDLVDNDFFGSYDDKTNVASGVYYKDSNNLPWAINIIHDFAYPKEKQEIMLGYPYFTTWAESGGDLYEDWYKEKDGYRNYDYLNRN
ncbi:LruC domain-containing protein [Labilibaculum antarcticum]|uniref:LruC domain-containing protein n=1 Tax=Labilibaculum antarcticum TaxID=1717717 RepID=A0A1Y1CPK8_9BACT|nr:LruC domain-containing protein [Labilibaculum antarcticum]BAX82184.1 LruC domain-containing protein [Labilibaculum antarcticum]